MSFSSRRRNYLLTPHRRDGLIEWMKEMLMHSFVLDALDTTGADTFSHFEMLIEEHRALTQCDSPQPSRLKQLVPTAGLFHTRLPLRHAFVAYNKKYALASRKHVCISFNELRHILNLAQVMAFVFSERDSPDEEQLMREENALKRWESSPSALLLTPRENEAPPPLNLDGSIQEESPIINESEAPRTMVDDNSHEKKSNVAQYRGPKLITFDGDQTLYSDGANFESNPLLASYLYMLLRHGVTIAVVTAAGYEYQAEKYELRLSGLLEYFKQRQLPAKDCARFYLFGGECNFLLNLSSDYRLHPVRERGPGGWITSTKYIPETPGNWNESSVQSLLDLAEKTMKSSLEEQNLRARIIRKKRAVGMIPKPSEQISREALDETVLRAHAELDRHAGVDLPFCAFNGGRDAWVDVGNKRVGVQVLQSYLGVLPVETLHIGDQFLNTGNDYAARDVCPCVWITCPDETTYMLKSILRLAGVSLNDVENDISPNDAVHTGESKEKGSKGINFDELERRTSMVQRMDVFTGEIVNQKQSPPPRQTLAKAKGDLTKK
mmetsp:Transcript_10647/g.31487  ORF Transcript_10647/g.31487 Transcript_10647/m.31487 type:complete len:551 (-) Transcript_10647:663-2315(-)|eukprot:CAMPEP_0113535998 /NCGR_PEP_ID=MMETSP0015_2-20120614/6015_1 /TAXON_ID=2838 /ORGANISM="Odontella" /LENGTH=550 /DNA_ID=CAMNT_0000435311 /DNA_START=225 /DNA_END=1877 /DNA_ORIENTATION=- /assembly_acc=CAM_ASM_000160